MLENKEQVQIRTIIYKTEAYRIELEVRDKVLRKPLGMSLYDENLEAEKQDTHFGAYRNDQLVGVLILTRLNATEVRMRQVAVLEEWQGQGVGSELVYYAEQYAKNKGYTVILLHARKTAAGFYEKLGYEKTGDEFLEINIPHYSMRKSLICRA
ncbi:MAG: GNAT family N-acetyltransferase [Bacteroidota bacterium]|nr:GNAT family N-acetyltransferase [Bacteroidota bacterium]